MIRDPSDGSVREPQKSATTSGLPAGSTKPENLARLEKSREWLKDYHKAKGGVQ